MREMDEDLAVGLVKGLIVKETDEETANAWNYLIQTKLIWKMDEWYQAIARELIDEQIVTGESNDKI